MLELALISLIIGCSVGAIRECNADALSVAARLHKNRIRSVIIDFSWSVKRGKTWCLMCRQWLLTIQCLDLDQLMRIIPIEAYAHCRHLSSPCCFHRHYSFLYSFSWQPFSLQFTWTSLRNAGWLAQYHHLLPSWALIKVVTLLIIQSKLLWQWPYLFSHHQWQNIWQSC
jgi:hypothetical protein